MADELGFFLDITGRLCPPGLDDPGGVLPNEDWAARHWLVTRIVALRLGYALFDHAIYRPGRHSLRSASWSYPYGWPPGLALTLGIALDRAASTFRSVVRRWGIPETIEMELHSANRSPLPPPDVDRRGWTGAGISYWIKPGHLIDLAGGLPEELRLWAGSGWDCWIPEPGKGPGQPNPALEADESTVLRWARAIMDEALASEPEPDVPDEAWETAPDPARDMAADILPDAALDWIPCSQAKVATFLGKSPNRAGFLAELKEKGILDYTLGGDGYNKAIVRFADFNEHRKFAAFMGIDAL